MKVISVVLLLALSGVASASSGADVSGDNTITKVVKLLQNMLEKSKADGKEEAELFAKFKCYCDTNELEKTTNIAKLTKQIGLLESQIEVLQGDNGELSSTCAELRQNMMDNEAARIEADSIRTKAYDNFVAEEADLKQAIGQMDEAIQTLADVGADQTLGNAAADHEKMMAGMRGSSLAALKTTVKQALAAASVFLAPTQKHSVEAFLQAPFTGSYTSQSAEIVGILKNMRDTFKQNLANAIATEATQKKAFDKFMELKDEEHAMMKAEYEEKQESLGANDDELSAKKEQKAAAEDTKADDEEFLAKLLAMCDAKSKDNEDRKMMRANEDAAIAEAVSILNSDAAFGSFGKTSATSTGATGFIQMSAVHRHMGSKEVSTRNTAIKILREVHSARTNKVVAMLKAENPFDKVLGEIEKMLDLIVQEGKADTEQLSWCNSEREENHANLNTANDQIDTLTSEIDVLETTIGAPETGLVDQIAETEDGLSTNYKSQVDQTKERTGENLAYQQNIKNLVSAQDILTKALKVLTKYYDMLEKKLEEDTALVQQTPPETWDKGFSGQSSKGGDAIDMLQFILGETGKEEKNAHTSENDAQHQFEDNMSDLKSEEADLQKSLAELQKTLAEKKALLLDKKEELAKTDTEKNRLEEYLADIKAGCDFITTNFDDREANRETETKALENASKLLKDTPIYKALKAKEHEDSLGDCKDTCSGGEDHVECKACLADVTVPAYCAGHKGTAGC